MKIVRDLSRGTPDGPAVLTLGVFDGLHLGHREIIGKVVKRANELGWIPSVITFDPHPRAVLQPDTAPQLIQTLEQRLEGFEALGIAQVAIIEFTRAVASIEAEDFIQRFLFDRLDAREIYLGSGASFGHRRRGNLPMLRQACARTGRMAEEVGEFRYHGLRVSATRVRDLIRQGRVNPARKLLCRPYTIIGEWGEGSGRDPKLNLATTSLQPLHQVLPAPGAYATAVLVKQNRWPAITRVNPRRLPGGGPAAEIHTRSLDSQADLTGHPVRLGFFHRLSGETGSDDRELMDRELEKNIARVRQRFIQPAYARELKLWTGW